MNTGVISSRYAKALLKFTAETGRGEQVCTQVRQMLAGTLPADTELEPELQSFVGLLRSRGRMEYLYQTLTTFVDLYWKSVGVKPAHLICVKEFPGLADRVREMLERQTGSKVLIETKVDPELIGGFIVEIDNCRLDASVRHQMDLLRRELTVKHNRII